MFFSAQWIKLLLNESLSAYCFGCFGSHDRQESNQLAGERCGVFSNERETEFVALWSVCDIKFMIMSVLGFTAYCQVATKISWLF